MDTNFSNSDSQGNSNISLQVEAEPLLKEAAKWGKILAIFGFISIGFFVLLSLYMFIAGGSAALLGGMRNSPMGTSFAGILGASMGFTYLIFAVLYFFPTNYLYKFSTKVATALKNGDTHSLTQGFGNLKSCFKFIGIMMIVMLCLYVFAFVLGIIGYIMR